MHPYFQSSFDALESQKSQTLDALKGLSGEQLNRRRQPGTWSIAEILSHIITSERLSVQYLQKKIQGIDQVRNSGSWENIKMGVLTLSLRLPGLKFKAPRKVVENTTLLTSLEQLSSEWTGVRSDMKTILENIPADKVKRLIYRQPRIGYINARQMLVFFSDHVTHHTPQIRRLIWCYQPGIELNIL